MNEEPGAEALQSLADLAGTAAVVTEELGIKIVERIANGATQNALRVDVHHRGEDFGNGKNGGFRRGIDGSGSGLRLLGQTQDRCSEDTKGGRGKSGERTPLACWFRRLAETIFPKSWRRRDGLA